MPIYAYRCAACGYQKDALQKLSDPPLTQCPECGQETFSKQVTAAGFQLKGSGWYVTDFRGGNNPAAATKPAGDAAAASGTAAPAASSGDSSSTATTPASTGNNGGNASSGSAGSAPAASTGSAAKSD